MSNMVSINQAVRRAKDDGLNVSGYALRLWIKRREFPVRYAGSKALIYYPELVRFLTGREVN